ncbi:MAG: hypothetical protein RLZZ480_660 [Candidatus Parcubacteria bacterium]|jgi:hypothetical protein
MIAATICSIVSIYFTIGTVWVFLPVTVGTAVMFALLFNNALIGDFYHKIDN